VKWYFVNRKKQEGPISEDLLLHLIDAEKFDLFEDVSEPTDPCEDDECDLPLPVLGMSQESKHIMIGFVLFSTVLMGWTLLYQGCARP